MASIQDRWRRKDPVTGRLVPTELDGKGLRYRPQFRDPSGRQVMKAFALKRDAQRWLDDQTAHIARGTYVDPGAGRLTFAEFYADWSSRQVWAPGTVLAMKLAADSVPFADVPLRSLRRSHVEGWVKGMVNRGLAPGTVHTRVNNVRAVIRGAVADKLIPSDPSVGVVLPRRRRASAAMTLPTAAQVGSVLEAAEDAFRPFVALCAFAGLRLGEAAGVRVEDVDFLRRTLTVARQVQRAGRGASRSGCPSTAASGSSSSRLDWSRCWRRTSPCTAPTVAGCSPEPARTRLTRTPSATGGAPPLPLPGSPDCDCTTSGTSTPRA